MSGPTAIERWASRVSGKDQRVRERESRRAAWARVQTEAPEMAAFLSECREVFGATDVLTIDLDGARVWDVTRADPAC